MEDETKASKVKNIPSHEFNNIFDLMIKTCHQMPDFIFSLFVNHNFNPKFKRFFNMLADAYLDLHAFALLFLALDWTQASILLRPAIERIAKITFLCKNSEALNRYIEIYGEECDYYKKDEKDKKTFLKLKGIKKEMAKTYFEYGFLEKYTDDGRYGRNVLFKMVGLDPYLIDIDQNLNKFVHAEVSIFQMSKDNWAILDRHINHIACCAIQLFNFLYLSTRSYFSQFDLPMPVDCTYMATASFVERFKY